MTDDDLDLLRRKAAAFDAIATCEVSIHREYLRCDPPCVYVYNIWVNGKAVSGDPMSVLDAIESALSVDRQTPKGTFGAEAE